MSSIKNSISKLNNTYNSNICNRCFIKFDEYNNIKCKNCNRNICINCLIEDYKKNNNIDNIKCYYCYKTIKLSKDLIFNIKYNSYKINNFCKKCGNSNLYKFDKQIICEKCNTYYCSKCFQQIYPEQIETFKDNIILIDNPNFKNYTVEQKCPHICKKEDIDFFNIIKNDYIRCPICQSLHQKDDNSNSILCDNTILSHILEISNDEIVHVYECLNHEYMKDILTHHKYEIM